MTKQPARLQRRTVLTTIFAGGAAAAATLAARTFKRDRPPVAEPQGRDGGAAAGKGYQETAHVRNYYRTTKI